MIYQDFLELLRAFGNHKVRYVIIGAHAYGIHVEPRYTKDIDFLVEPTTTNAKRILKALKDFGAPIDNLTVKDLVKLLKVRQLLKGRKKS